jgi:hypothetical protein
MLGLCCGCILFAVLLSITVAPPHVEMGNEMAGGCCICTKLLGLSNAGSAAGCSKDRVVITLVATGSEQTVGEIQAKSQLARFPAKLD